MTRRSRRSILDHATPIVEQLVSSLREKEENESADAVESILGLARDAVDMTARQAKTDEKYDQPFAIAVEFDLWNRVSENAPNISQTIITGWEKFLAGEWTPTQPVRAGIGDSAGKANLNVRVPRQLLQQIEAAADQMVSEKGWSTRRGYKLNARQVAAQWLARQFPERADGESKAAK